jgi:hypothetical protein
MQETTTRVPLAWRALLAIIESLFDASETTVLAGMPTGRTLLPEVVSIGFAANGPAIDVAVERMPGFGHRYLEDATIQCAISIAGGDQTDPLALADRVGVMHAAITEAVKADPTLSGAVDAAEVTGAHSWLTSQMSTGPVVDALFSVRVKSAL